MAASLRGLRAASTSASGAVAIQARKRPEVLVIRLQGRLQRPRPAKPLKLRRDLGVIHVWIIAAAGADEFEHVGVAAFDAAVYDADRLAPHEGRPAMAGLPGKRECHFDRRPHAQPRISAVVQTQRRDGGRANSGSGTGPGVRIVKAGHPTHRPVSNSSATGGWSSVALRETIRADTARRKVEPSWTVPDEALFSGRLPQRRVTFAVVGMRVEMWASSPEPAVGGSMTPGTRQGHL
jgi:hypothetical protein